MYYTQFSAHTHCFFNDFSWRIGPVSLTTFLLCEHESDLFQSVYACHAHAHLPHIQFYWLHFLHGHEYNCSFMACFICFVEHSLLCRVLHAFLRAGILAMSCNCILLWLCTTVHCITSHIYHPPFPASTSGIQNETTLSITLFVKNLNQNQKENNNKNITHMHDTVM